MVRVFIVDDSTIFRQEIRNALSNHPEIEVVGLAPNGKIALQKLQNISVDVLVLDLEMPELDGLGTLRALKSLGLKMHTIVFSGCTVSAAEATLNLLAEGADDFIAKPQSDGSTSPSDLIARDLIPKVLQFQNSLIPAPVIPIKRAAWSLGSPSWVVFGSSTGGPKALDSIFSQLRGPFGFPIVVVQHMPPVFTGSLAERLAKLTGLIAKEAQNGEVAEANKIYVAPGGFHLSVSKVGGRARFQLDQGPLVNSIRPSVDRFLFSLAAMEEKSAVFILTGMGKDGADGCKRMKLTTSFVGTQISASCVVDGMPGSVRAVGASDAEFDLTEMANHVNQWAVPAQKLRRT